MIDAAKKHRKACGKKAVHIGEAISFCTRCGWNYVPLTMSCRFDKGDK